MESGRISYSYITASSALPNNSATAARLNTGKYNKNSWCAAKVDKSEYLEVVLVFHGFVKLAKLKYNWNIIAHNRQRTERKWVYAEATIGGVQGCNFIKKRNSGEISEIFKNPFLKTSGSGCFFISNNKVHFKVERRRVIWKLVSRCRLRYHCCPLHTLIHINI